MTTNHAKVPMDPMRKTALVAGVLYFVTFVGSIPALPLYHNILHNPHYILGGASDTGVLWGAVGEVICALAGIGTAVALYPVAKRHSGTAALLWRGRRRNREADRVLEAVTVKDRAHVEIVGHNQTLKAHFFAEQLGNNAPR